MGRIVSLHSYRGGTGKSNITANLAYLTASRGHTVAVLDTDIQSPGVHLIFGIEPDRITYTLSDFVFGKCELEETVYDVSGGLDLGNNRGRVYLLPSSMAVEDISRVLADGYEVNRLNKEFKKLIGDLDLDFLFLDTHPGLNRETLLTTAISDCLVLLIRPDRQDYHGTAVLVEVARRLQVPRIYMLANKVVGSMDSASVRTRIREAFGYEVIGLLPLDEAMASLGSRGLFSREYPGHSLTAELGAVTDRLLESLAPEPPHD